MKNSFLVFGLISLLSVGIPSMELLVAAEKIQTTEGLSSIQPAQTSDSSLKKLNSNFSNEDDEVVLQD
ncbi:MAG: hypothetical protein A3F17_05965 [Gammaproteobacteria bacterium RIFCSPHIGHO2_12_FULL_41_15]|nr:MAG: hypothetical protein A3F17_05965 [Gammaproteobacteria bacterium RIFCSPHIGHO2_12_FULL_41_15]